LYFERLAIFAIFHPEKSGHHRMRTRANVVQVAIDEFLVYAAPA
jgi:hypothetical protein